MSDFIHFGNNHKNNLFYSFLNACHQVKFEENFINKFREKFKYIDFGTKNTHCSPFFA